MCNFCESMRGLLHVPAGKPIRNMGDSYKPVNGFFDGSDNSISRSPDEIIVQLDSPTPISMRKRPETPGTISVYVNGRQYGIPVAFCPVCGQKL